MKKKVQTSYKASEPILVQNATPLIMAVANEELKKRDGSTLGSITTHWNAYTFPERPRGKPIEDISIINPPQQLAV